MPEPRLTPNAFRDTWDKSPEERAFLAKLDACLITYAALSYFSKYLDQQNVTVRLTSDWSIPPTQIYIPSIECIRLRNARGVSYSVVIVH